MEKKTAMRDSILASVAPLDKSPNCTTCFLSSIVKWNNVARGRDLPDVKYLATTLDTLHGENGRCTTEIEKGYIEKLRTTDVKLQTLGDSCFAIG